MKLFDTHAHYDSERFKKDAHALLSTMPEQGVGLIANIGTDLESSRQTVELCEQYPFVYGAVGFHPHEAKSLTQAALDEIERMLAHPKVKALGEIGLDYHYDFSERDVQRRAFAQQLEVARAHDIPIVIHEREACADAIEILKASGVRKGVVHCFGGSKETAKILLDLGFHISFTGVITFDNARKAYEVVPYIPADRIMVETDCPYLTPVPFRGKKNHSGYLRHTVEKMAEMRGISFEECAAITWENGLKFYGIKE